jgi:superfamily II DNA/RNA helicase
MHSDLEQAKREEVMLDFKNGKIDLLVATDIVARGIDIEDIGVVINYDVPHDPEDYIHRIGRTARASASGRAVTFVNEQEQEKFHRIERFIERDIEKLPLPASLGEAPAYCPDDANRRRSRGGKGRGGARRKGDNNAATADKSTSGRTSRGSRRHREAAVDKPSPSAQPEGTPSAQPTATPATASSKEKEGASRRRHRHGRRRSKGNEQGSTATAEATPAPATER